MQANRNELNTLRKILFNKDALLIFSFQYYVNWVAWWKKGLPKKWSTEKNTFQIFSPIIPIDFIQEVLQIVTQRLQTGFDSKEKYLIVFDLWLFKMNTLKTLLLENKSSVNKFIIDRSISGISLWESLISLSSRIHCSFGGIQEPTKW